MILIVLGLPGSGKGTQAEKLAKTYNIPHISIGEMYRNMAKEQTEFGQKIREIMNKGELIPDEISNEIIRDRVLKPDCIGGFILDGYPRTMRQVKGLEEFAKPDVVIYLDVPEKEIIKRLSNRRVCSNCGANFNLITNPPKKDEICDFCGSKLTWREDDKPEAIRTRIKVQSERMKPVLEYYKNNGKLITINGDQPIDKVFEEIRSKLR
ncbi:MAG: adenylate kinase [Candidatus Njordarchaeales archaeon]